MYYYQSWPTAHCSSLHCIGQFYEDFSGYDNHRGTVQWMKWIYTVSLGTLENVTLGSVSRYPPQVLWGRCWGCFLMRWWRWTLASTHSMRWCPQLLLECDHWLESRKIYTTKSEHLLLCGTPHPTCASPPTPTHTTTNTHTNFPSCSLKAHQETNP